MNLSQICLKHVVDTSELSKTQWIRIELNSMRSKYTLEPFSSGKENTRVTAQLHRKHFPPPYTERLYLAITPSNLYLHV